MDLAPQACRVAFHSKTSHQSSKIGQSELGASMRGGYLPLAYSWRWFTVEPMVDVVESVTYRRWLRGLRDRRRTDSRTTMQRIPRQRGGHLAAGPWSV